MSGEANLAWSRAVIDALVHGGIAHACVSPGSRSAPLAVAVAERADLSSSVFVDERSAAYFALGCARASARPVLLVCTSGTAAANYLPALVEAHYSRVPLVVLTADRPHELRDTGSWQTIDQVKLYGPYVRWFADMALPEEALQAYARNVASRAVATARARPSGPVHLNVPFREPLLPARYAPRDTDTAGAPAVAGTSTVAPTATVADDAAVAALAEHIRSEPRGLIVAGACAEGPAYAPALARLAALAGYPILAEPAGHLRHGNHDGSLVLCHYDALLRDAGWADAHVPALALRFGATPVWKQVAQWLARHPRVRQVVVDPQVTWDDPTRHAREWFHVDALPLIRDLSDRLASEVPPRSLAGDDGWAGSWRDADRVAGRALERLVSTTGADRGHGDGATPHVAWVYRALGEDAPEGAWIYAANSMAVRDLDTFLPRRTAELHVAANRGAAGIDGTISSALGTALGSGRPTILVTGDLAFAHDAGGLQAARIPGLRATVVVLNDGGGGIFRYLPVEQLPPDLFASFFVAPSGLSVAVACAAHGVPHRAVRDAAQLAEALRQAADPGVRVVEIAVDPIANVAFHRAYWRAVSDALRASGRV